MDVIESVSAAVLLGMTATVLLAYAWIAAQGKGGALTWHVALVAFSYTLLIAEEMLERGDALPEGEADVEPIAYVIGIVALTVLFADLNRRRRSP